MIDIVMILCVSGRFVHICENLPSARKTFSQQDFTVCIGSKKTDLRREQDVTLSIDTLVYNCVFRYGNVKEVI